MMHDAGSLKHLFNHDSRDYEISFINYSLYAVYVRYFYFFATVS